ncbi:MAG: hypothetical protein ACKOFW_01520, partial [Planctomycetaceae bacterium]
MASPGTNLTGVPALGGRTPGNSAILEPHRLNNVCWPTVRPLKTPCYRHAEAGWLAEQPSRFL